MLFNLALVLAASAATATARALVPLSSRQSGPVPTVVSPQTGHTYYAFQEILPDNGGKVVGSLNVTLADIPKGTAALKFSLQGDSKVPPTYEFGIDGDYTETYIPQDGAFSKELSFPDAITNMKFGSSAKYTFGVQSVVFDCKTGNPSENPGPYLSYITVVIDAPPS